MALLVGHADFGGRWLLVQWRRARAHSRLLERIASLEGELSDREARIALAPGAPPLEVAGVILKGDEFVLVLDVGSEDGVVHGDFLLLIDRLERRLIGRAEVNLVEDQRCEAPFLTLEPVFKGFLHERAQDLQRRLPEEIIALNERVIHDWYRQARTAQEGANG